MIFFASFPYLFLIYGDCCIVLKAFIIIIDKIYFAFSLCTVFVLFCWSTVSADFWANRPGDWENYLFAENLRAGKLGGKACVLCCLFIYLFIYLLFIIFSYNYFLFTLRELLIRSRINSAVERRGVSYFYKAFSRF